jgi:hypothetical protein
VILVAAMIIKKRRVSGLVKLYGVPYVPKESSASLEALQGSAGSSAMGGVESDSAWDDKVESLDFSAEHNTEEGTIVSDEETTEQMDAESFYDDSSSIEDIAGMPQTQAPVAEVAAAATQPPAQTAPLPEGGLPAGWTMEQWQWYGHEWLAKNAK